MEDWDSYIEDRDSTWHFQDTYRTIHASTTKAEFFMEIDKMKEAFAIVSEYIIALAQICSVAISKPDFQFPHKHYKYLHSKWFCAGLYQVVNQGSMAYGEQLYFSFFKYSHARRLRIQSDAQTLQEDYKGLMILHNNHITTGTKIKEKFNSLVLLLQELQEIITTYSAANKILLDINDAVANCLKASLKLNQLWHGVQERLNSSLMCIETLEKDYQFPSFQHVGNAYRSSWKAYKAYILALLSCSLYTKVQGHFEPCIVLLDEMLATTDFDSLKEQENTLVNMCNQSHGSILEIAEKFKQQITKKFS